MKRIILSGLAGMLALSAGAALLTPENALRRALGDAPARVAGTNAPSDFRLALTRQYEGQDAVYLFTLGENGGFIVAAADDNCPVLLGYGDSPVRNAAGDMSPEFLYWLDELGRQVAYAASREPHLAGLTERPDREPIAPLCSTRWNQRNPYNDQCPGTYDNRAVTGCVATAMSQVMKYHNWPPTGEGTHSYESPTYGELSINFAEQEFDWDYMLDTYDYTESERSREAVALLMKCAGYSVDMDYSPVASGTPSIVISTALSSFFRYDKSMRYCLRSYYTLYDWEEMIYNSLVNDGPVIYDGQSQQGGHSFVCDGYDTDGYFHINWGWGGMSDGYFLLDALDPYEQGVGGSNSGFNRSQDCILGIRPDRDGDSVWAPWLGAYSGLEMSVKDFLTVDGTILNFGPGPLDHGCIGLSFIALDGTESMIGLDLIDEEVPPLWGFSTLQFDKPELEKGRYEVNVVYTTSESATEILPIIAPLGATSSYLLTVTDKRQTMQAIGTTEPNVELTEYPEEFNPQIGATLKGKINNVGRGFCVSYLSALLLDEDNRIVAASDTSIRILSYGSAKDLEMTAKFDDADGILAKGNKYNLVVADMRPFDKGAVLLTEPVEVTIGEDTGVETLTDPAAEEAPKCWTIEGLPVELGGEGAPAAPGVYIIRQGNRTSKITVR